MIKRFLISLFLFPLPVVAFAATPAPSASPLADVITKVFDNAKGLIDEVPIGQRIKRELTLEMERARLAAMAAIQNTR